MAKVRDILSFWIDEVGPAGWYAGGEELDATVRERFSDDWTRAREGQCELCLTTPDAALAYCILTDQFPRNMFRDDPRAFSSDKQARACAKKAISRNWDMSVPEPQRQFLYMPLVHSENLIDQDRAIRLFMTRMPEGRDHMLLHARAHRSIIRKFGRFPTRNAALGRAMTDAEAAWIDGGGYGSEVRTLEAA